MNSHLPCLERNATYSKSKSALKMVREEVSEAELRRLQSWNDLHSQNSCGTISRKSIVVVTIYDSDEEDDSSSRTASCSTPDNGYSEKNSSNSGEIANIQLCPDRKDQSSLNLRTCRPEPLVPKNLISTPHISAVSSKVGNIANALSRVNDITGSMYHNSYIEYVSNNTGYYETNSMKSNVSNPDGIVRENYHSIEVGFCDTPKYRSHPDSHIEGKSSSTKNYVIKLRESANKSMKRRECISFNAETTPHREHFQTTKNPVVANLFSENEIIQPLDFSNKNRTNERNHHDFNDISNDFADEDIINDSNIYQLENDTIIVDNVNGESIDAVITNNTDNINVSNVDGAAGILHKDHVVTYVVEPEEGMVMAAPCMYTDEIHDIPIDKNCSTDVGDIDHNNMNVVSKTVEHRKLTQVERISDARGIATENLSLPSTEQSRRSKRFPPKKSNSDSMKRKSSELDTCVTPANYKKKFTRQTKCGQAAAAAERRARRGGVVTRALCRNMLSVGSVWRRPTPSDVGPRRTWPAEGMHERPVWPLAGAAAPPSPPRLSPSPDPADLARQREIEIRLHWALAACFQVYKDAKNNAEKPTSVFLRSKQTFKNQNTWIQEKSVQKIYLEYRLYHFIDNEISKMFLKNGKIHNKFRGMAGIITHYAAHLRIYPLYFSQCPLMESIRNCFLMKLNDHTIDSKIEGIPYKSISENGTFNKINIDLSKTFKDTSFNSRNNRNIHHISSLDERKRELLEKINRYIEINFINSNVDRYYESEGILQLYHGMESMLDALCCIMYSISREYCKINNISSNALALYIETLTPNLLMEWVEENIEYESEIL